MTREVILCDVDGVIANCSGAVHRAAQDFVLVHGLLNGGKTPDFNHVVPPAAEQAQFEFEPWLFPHVEDYARFVEYELSRDRLGWEIELFPDAERFIAELQKLGEVVFCTSQWSGMGCWVPARERLLHSHFPGVDIVFTHAKHRVHGSYLIDDKPSTIRHPGNKDRGLLFDQPWNRKDTDLDDWRFEGYDAVLDALGGGGL
jgi:5'(3')-deoxyribonucleotidase